MNVDPRRLGYKWCSDGVFRKTVEFPAGSDRKDRAFVLSMTPSGKIIREKTVNRAYLEERRAA